MNFGMSPARHGMKESWFWPVMFMTAAAVMAACALVHRHLYADGSFFLIQVLEKRAFTTFDTPRVFAHYIMQAPVWAAINWVHISNVRILSWIFGLTLFLHPVASLLGCWLILKRRNRALIILPALCWACLTMCTSFFIISESWIGVSLFWPVYFLLIFRKHRLTRIESLFLVAMSFASIRVYEGFLLQACLLAFLACRRIHFHLKDRRAEIASTIALICFCAAIATDLYWTVFPRDPGNRVSLLLGLAGNLIYPAAYVALFALILFLKPNLPSLRCAARCRAVFLAAAFIWALMPWIFIPSIMAYMHGFIRIINNLLPVALAILPLAATQMHLLRPTLSRERRAIFAGFMLSLVMWQLGANYAWARYTNEFSGILSSGRGYLRLQDTGLSRYGFDWSWTMPCMSVALSGIQEKPMRSIVMNKPGRGWEPFNPKVVGSYPDLGVYGVKYEITADELRGSRLGE